MGDVPDRVPRRKPGAHRPERSVVFPTPWPLPSTVVSGWFCPSEQWPAQTDRPRTGWPGRDFDDEEREGGGVP